MLADLEKEGFGKSKDEALAKALTGEGLQQYRKKLKLPEMSEAAQKCKEEVCTSSEVLLS